MMLFMRKLWYKPAPQLRCLCTSNFLNNKLFVGGLSSGVDEKSLKEAFSSFGDVTEDTTGSPVCSERRGDSSFARLINRGPPSKTVDPLRIVYDKDSGRSRGFGFVHFSKDDEARSAKDAMDGKAMLGRPLRISFALEKVRGGPVVVPRLSNVANTDHRYNRTF